MQLRDLKNWHSYWKRLQSALLEPRVDEAELEASLRQAREHMPVPVIWLVGKTQAGKTSIIRALTGNDQALIGDGYRPCTRASRLYDYPADMPVVRFLDTRGLGEVAYDPDEDLAYCEAQAHLVLAVMKLADADQDAVLDVLKTVRRRHPDWPLLVAHTGLHELYPPADDHLQPYPYATEPLPDRVPPELARALEHRRKTLSSLPGTAPVRHVAIDFTHEDDGYEPRFYGLDALWEAIEDVSSFGLQVLLQGDEGVRGVYARSAHQHIVGYTWTAAGLGALPAVDLVAVSAVQAKLLHTLAHLYGQRWDRRTTTEFIGLMGASVAGGLVSRMVSKSVVKFIPMFGQTVGAVWGASTSGATTYALGKAAAHFFSRRSQGDRIDADTLRRVYAEAFADGSEMLRRRSSGSGPQS